MFVLSKSKDFTRKFHCEMLKCMYYDCCICLCIVILYTSICDGSQICFCLRSFDSSMEQMRDLIINNTACLIVITIFWDSGTGNPTKFCRKGGNRWEVITRWVKALNSEFKIACLNPTRLSAKLRGQSSFQGSWEFLGQHQDNMQQLTNSW